MAETVLLVDSNDDRFQFVRLDAFKGCNLRYPSEEDGVNEKISIRNLDIRVALRQG